MNAVSAGLLAAVVLLANPSALAQRTTANSTEDCRPYNPKALRIQQYPFDWIIWAPLTTARGGNQPVAGATNKQDLANAQALVERYSEVCYIGRRTTGRSKRDNPDEYFFNYWKNPTGKSTVIAPETCTTYVPSKLSIVDKNESGWIVTDGSGLTLKLDNHEDAQAALTFAKAWTTHCTIGKAIWTPLIKEAPVHYWKK